MHDRIQKMHRKEAIDDQFEMKLQCVYIINSDSVYYTFSTVYTYAISCFEHGTV
jgi:hypothetical protein